MKLNEALERALTALRRVKEAHVRDVKGKAGRTDIHTVIDVYRGDDPVAVIFLSPDRDAMLAAAAIAAIGFGPDVMAVSMETWNTGPNAQAGVHPLTGKAMENGDLADLADNHDGLARGLVSEALVTEVVNRAGDSAFAVLPYRIEGRGVEWDEPIRWGTDRKEGEVFMGLVHDALTRAMTLPTAPLAMGELTAAIGMEQERAQALGDLAAFRALHGHVPSLQAVLLTARRGSLRDQVLKEALPRSAIRQPPV